MSTTNSAAVMAPHTAAGQQDTSSANPSSNTKFANNVANTPQGSTPSGPQYLVKTLKVSMLVKDTRNVANEIQGWISATDPRSSTAGSDYEQAGDNLYTVSLTFSVQASLYPQIYNYLRSYVPKQGGQLQSFTESVQDVSNDYVDTQSRLKNLRVEQQRIQELLSRAQALGDVIVLEQKLSDIEGQIENIEQHLNQLTGQVTFYTVTLTLQPSDTASPAPATTGWNAGQIFHDAFSASLALGQGLLNFLIWLFAFSFYLIPAAAIAWLVWRARSRPRGGMPKPAGTARPQDTDE